MVVTPHVTLHAINQNLLAITHVIIPAIKKDVIDPATTRNIAADQKLAVMVVDINNIDRKKGINNQGIINPIFI
jgi:hypothetical protein